MPAVTLTVSRPLAGGGTKRNHAQSGIDATTGEEGGFEFTIALAAISFAPEAGDRLKVMGDGNPTRTVTSVTGGGEGPYVVTAPIPS